MSKTKYFLSDKNVQQMIKRIYLYAVNNGSEVKIEKVKTEIPELMHSWSLTARLDSYESLLFDPLAEMEQINDEFFSKIIMDFIPQVEKLNKFETPADYHNFDTSPAPDITISTQVYRNNNKIPINKIQPIRQYDRDEGGSGLKGRSIDTFIKGYPGMDEYEARMNKPYKRMDRNDTPYWGQTIEDSSTVFTNTLWRTT